MAPADMGSGSSTIFALSTIPGRSGIAIIRISGPQAGSALNLLTGQDEPPLPRRAGLFDLTDPASDEIIDKAIVLYFPAPHSFTGEDVAEIHCHGSRAVIDRLLAVLATQPGLALADPGEFTRRAFEHGKMDLTQVEGLADLINAETEQQRRQAQRQMTGQLGALYEVWRQTLIKALAYLELSVDFPDEDTPDDTRAQILPDIRKLEELIDQHLAQAPQAERLRDGVRIVLAGAPNAGKSTLLNALARRDVAIVSDEAGTTRDVLEVHLDLGGVPVIISDTAGLRDAPGSVESQGISRARAQLAQADLRIAIVDRSEVSPQGAGVVDTPSALVLAKSDLTPHPAVTGHAAGSKCPVFPLSAKTGDGLSGFLSYLTDQAHALAGMTPAPSATRLRHRTELEACRAGLRQFLQAPAEVLPELAAEDIRVAIRALGRITGRVEVDELLDVIFRDFCIGK